MRLTERAPEYAWLVVGLLVPVALLNYLDRQMLAAMKFSLMADIPTIETEANWGKILAMFKWTYALMSPIGGYLADRYSRRCDLNHKVAAGAALCFPALNPEGASWSDLS